MDVFEVKTKSKKVQKGPDAPKPIFSEGGGTYWGILGHIGTYFGIFVFLYRRVF